jgi:hypothetical protein
VNKAFKILLATNQQNLKVCQAFAEYCPIETSDDQAASEPPTPGIIIGTFIFKGFIMRT